MRCARQDEKWLQAHMILVIWDSSNSPSFRVLKISEVRRRCFVGSGCSGG
ncbi:hypothetical protein SERLA73DRAFT_181004 [Serpula lacrymans var. lacrymans S7.3]|uniref:Uncharacterized protein n=1 Tax=Serpula lacrymans var. lacrymans (strain S7.3) TaxID=936435 RepID=F8PUA9_SERL3|nr:hypothetical protein SERLA73DRAFT_181004 [Serpula lacrymans var. lacrymans S7.3]